MSLRATALGLWWRSNPRIIGEIASGEKQERPRNDILSLVGEGTYIFTNPYMTQTGGVKSTYTI